MERLSPLSPYQIARTFPHKKICKNKKHDFGKRKFFSPWPNIAFWTESYFDNRISKTFKRKIEYSSSVQFKGKIKQWAAYKRSTLLLIGFRWKKKQSQR